MVKILLKRSKTLQTRDQVKVISLPWLPTSPLCPYRALKILFHASLTGLGACFNNLVYTSPIPPGFNNYTIVHLEMENVLVALKLWTHLWPDKWVRLYCDNQAVVQVLSTGNTRDTVLGACARSIWLLTAMYNISIDFTHIVGTPNVVADLLSRWKYDQVSWDRLYKLIPNPLRMNAHIDSTLLNYDI